jgi:hypothetical protein
MYLDRFVLSWMRRVFSRIHEMRKGLQGDNELVQQMRHARPRPL